MTLSSSQSSAPMSTTSLPQLVKMRAQAERTRRDEMEKILDRRKFLLGQLFYMKQLEGTEDGLDPSQDFSRVDSQKLGAFQESHCLTESKLPSSPFDDLDSGPTSSSSLSSHVQQSPQHQREAKMSVDEEHIIPMKQESITPRALSPSESAVVVPDLTSDSAMEMDTDGIEHTNHSATIKQESSPMPLSSRDSPDLSNHERHQTPEPRTPTSIPGTQTNSAETSPSRKTKRVLPPPERMVTRGVSGAIRHRSVDEILGTATERSPPASSGTKIPQQEKSSPSSTPVPSPAPSVHTTSPAPTSALASAATTNRLITPGAMATTSSSLANGLDKSNVIKLISTKKTPPRTTTPPVMKRSESRHGSRYDPMDGHSSGRNSRHVDLYAWQLMVQSQPMYKALQTASKALTTKDWKVAREELKLMRAMQRIEALKAGNRWSFKQMKKHRAPPRTKTHWDHLLDEMRWMQVDFKEERRWKVATAYQVSRWVMAWHEAEDKSTVCIHRKPPRILDVGRTVPTEEPATQPAEPAPEVKVEDYLEESAMETSQEGPSSQHSGMDVDMMEVNAKLESTIKDKGGEALTTDSKLPEETVKLKVEEEDTPMPLTSLSTSSGAASREPGTSASTAVVKDEPTDAETVDGDKTAAPKLKEQAKDVMLMMPPPISPASIQKCRPVLLGLDPTITVFNLDSLSVLMEENSNIATLDINLLFPDLPLYGPPSPDDNDPYIDEAEFGRLTMINRLISSKPPQLDFGPLASQVVYKKRKRDNYEPSDEFPEEEDARVPRLEGKILNAVPGTEPARMVPVLFQAKKIKDAPAPVVRRPNQPAASANRPPVTWAADEEDLLISLVKPYQFNWELVADLFNSMRGPIPSSERRTPWDCYERWAKRETLQAGANTTATDSSSSSSGLIPIGNLPSANGPSPTSPKSRKDKDGKKLVASIKIDPIKKKQRSLGLLEAIRRSTKKREQALKNNPSPAVAAAAAKKALAGQDGNGPKVNSAPLTPADLSKFKSDRDRQISQAINEQRQMQAASLALGRPLVRPAVPGTNPIEAAQQLARAAAVAANPQAAVAVAAAAAAAAAQQRTAGQMSPQLKAGVRPLNAPQVQQVQQGVQQANVSAQVQAQ
ncbi:chromatin modification- protein VID21, partial [Actinomortierella ambigua]